MLHYFNKKYDLNLNITEEKPDPVDRTLRSKKTLCEKLKIPSVEEMVEEI